MFGTNKKSITWVVNVTRIHSKIIKKKRERAYLTPRMNGPRIKPLVVVFASTPSSLVAETVIVVLPKPRTRDGLTIRSSPLSNPGIVPVVVFPARMRPPSRVIDQVI